MDGNFLSHAHYRDPYFDFIHLPTKLISNQLLSKILNFRSHTYVYYLATP